MLTCKSDRPHALMTARRTALRLLGKIGAGEGARTLDPDLGKVVLYHVASTASDNRAPYGGASTETFWPQNGMAEHKNSVEVLIVVFLEDHRESMIPFNASERVMAKFIAYYRVSTERQGKS